MSEFEQEFLKICENARAAQKALNTIPANVINAALIAGALEIEARKAELIEANRKDIAYGKEKQLSEAMIDRLMLDEERIKNIADSLRNIAELPSPVGEVLRIWENPNNGLKFQRVAVAIGVIGIIYESRPNVTADAGALCLKAGNSVILRGGSESFYSSSIIADCLQAGLEKHDVPINAIQLINHRDRAFVELILQAVGKIDLLIPRGGKGLTERVITSARVPVLAHLDGNCHIYLDRNLQMDVAIAVTINAKMRRTGICGALETLLVHEDIADKILPKLLPALHAQDCEIRGDEAVQKIYPDTILASEQDWHQEYLAPILAVKIVSSTDDAIDHIEKYGSHHSDAIITTDETARDLFFARVDSANVMHNCSTQYADGGEFGMGAEIGIATGRLHARGPVALRELVTYKNLVFGNGQCRP